VLYGVIDEHLEAFLETARCHADGSGLPRFVEQEFRDFLTCGGWRTGSRACGAPTARSSGSSPSPARAGASAPAVAAGA
jgi:hypothetical protein